MASVVYRGDTSEVDPHGNWGFIVPMKDGRGKENNRSRDHAGDGKSRVSKSIMAIGSEGWLREGERRSF